MHIESLNIYPIKSARSIAQTSAYATSRGFEYDRRWIITDTDDQFLTLRTFAPFAQLIATPVGNGLRLEVDGKVGAIDVVTPTKGDRRSVTIWGDQVEALPADVGASAWLSEAFGRDVRLYFMDEGATRETPELWGPKKPVSFADAFPFLITTTASLAALNNEIAQTGGMPVAMERFRPNIVIDGSEPWEEDRWRAIQIGDVVFDLVKPCDRCVMTTRDPRTGENLGKEPLKSLAKLRMSDHPEASGVLFGWNMVARSEGEIKIGDAVSIVEDRPEGWPLKKPH